MSWPGPGTPPRLEEGCSLVNGPSNMARALGGNWSERTRLHGSKAQTGTLSYHTRRGSPRCPTRQSSPFLLKTRGEGLPWWLSGKESACQCRRRGFHPWSGKIPRAEKQLSPCAATPEPALQSPEVTSTEPALQSPCSTTGEASAIRSPCTTMQRKAHSNEDPAQP